MSTWQSYRLEDFIPFTPEVYWRLIERVNEAFWPLQLLTVALGLAAVTLALRGNARIALLLLAPAWLSSGIIFHLNYYAELNWAAPWFGWAFILQAGLLMAIATFPGRSTTRDDSNKPAAWIGATIAVGALLGYPLIAAAPGAAATHAETFGLHPDPTAIAAIGIVLIALRGASAWLALAIPFLWCAITSLTLAPLQAAWAWLPLTLAAIAALSCIARSIKRREADRPPR